MCLITLLISQIMFLSSGCKPLTLFSFVHLPRIPHFRNCTLKRGTSIVMLPVALVIPLHGYFMIICGFFKICIVHTALPLLCLTATRKISFVLSFAVFFRRVFEVSNINKNHEVLRLNLSTFQPVSPKLNDKERSSISFCSIGLMFEIKSNRVCLLCQSRADRREILVGRDLIR